MSSVVAGFFPLLADALLPRGLGGVLFVTSINLEFEKSQTVGIRYFSSGWVKASVINLLNIALYVDIKNVPR